MKEHPYDSGKLLAFINLRSCLKNVIQNKQARQNMKNKKRMEILGYQKQFKAKHLMTESEQDDES